MIRNLVFSAVISFALIAQAASAQDLVAKFDGKGLSSLKWGKDEVLKRAQVDLHSVKFQPGEPAPTRLEPTGRKFDAATKTLEQKYSFGSISTKYDAKPGRLDLEIEVRNTDARKSIYQFDLGVMQIKLPGKLKGEPWEQNWHLVVESSDSLPVLGSTWDGGAFAVCNMDVDRSIGFGMIPQGDNSYSVVIRFNGPPYMGNNIDTNDARKFHLSLRFGGKGASLAGIAKDVYEAYGKAFPATLNWSDHRPIGQAVLCSSEKRSPSNPRGWFGDSDFKLTSPTGPAEFKERVLKYADECVKHAKAMDAQGIIVWDVEGQEMPHAISYIGDPRLLPVLAPEMDAVADEFFKKLSDAGLKTGVTLRPSRVVPSIGSKNAWEHMQMADPAEEICEKVAYARERWGCTIFYVDSTVLWLNTMQGEPVLRNLNADIMRTLSKRFPDTLFMPENENPRYWAYSAPYNELGQKNTSTPPEVKIAYPNAFTLLRVTEGEGKNEKDESQRGRKLYNMDERWDELVAAVRAGDVLLYRTWWEDPDNAKIKRIYQEAKQPGAADAR